MTRVLIAGGGPVGLTLACELARHGVECRLVDSKAERDPWSKAAAILPRTQELLADMGLIDRFLERGNQVTAANLMKGSERLAHLEMEFPDTQFSSLLGLSQRETEELLEARLEELGGRLERPVELASFEQNDDGIAAVLTHPGGRLEEITVDWLIGCDGAHSVVRKSLDIPFEGDSFERWLVQGDVAVDLPFDQPASEAFVFPSGQGVLALLPLFSPGRYRMIAIDPPSHEATLELFQSIADARAPEGTRVSDPHWMGAFQFHGRLAERYRVGRVFLAGDAAHIHSPVGGQGMNMGMQDAYNLAWKLALVVRGVAHEALLDSYEAERRPVAQAVVNATDQATRTGLRVMSSENVAVEHFREQLFNLMEGLGYVRNAMLKRLGGISVGYPESPIVSQSSTPLLWSRVDGNEDDETPTVGDTLRFARGIGPGQRVPDLPLQDGSLFELIEGTHHNVLLFDGPADTEDGRENLREIRRQTKARLGDTVRVHIVTPHDIPGAVSDPELALHDHFGVSSEALCVIRPDGYLGFRSQPASADELNTWLDGVFGSV